MLNQFIQNAFIKLSIVALVFTTQISFASENESMGLVAKEMSEGYNQYFETVNEGIEYAKKTITDQAELEKLVNLQRNFQYLCADKDFADEIMWRHNEGNKTNIVFTCFDSYGASQGTSFVFDLLNDEELKSFSEVKIEMTTDESKSNGLKLVLKESIALVGSAALSAVAAKAFFPNHADKVKHAVASSLLASVITAAAHHFFNISPKYAALIGGLSSCGLGIGKEIYDKKHPDIHTSDIKDIAADSVGCAIGAFGMQIAIQY